jgi:hypothetical protein
VTISQTVYNLFTNIMSKSTFIPKAQNTTGKLDCLIFEVYATFLQCRYLGTLALYVNGKNPRTYIILTPLIIFQHNLKYKSCTVKKLYLNSFLIIL